MFDNAELGKELFRNPLLIQQKVLEEHESRLDGTVTIADPNNTFNFLLEASSAMTADAVALMEGALRMYPRRAQSSEDLYAHMSDYDYVGILSNPATLSINLYLNKTYLIDNALQYNDNYNKVVIPKDTIFVIGKYQFGMYYPVEIQINRSTNSINVVYDTSENNPLYTLSTNTLTKEELTYKNIEMIAIQIPVYQFSRSTTEEDLEPSLGFTKTYDYTDQFYAIRAFNKKDGVYEEMNYTLSEYVYDPTVPTLKIKLLSEEKKVRVTIPQVYFTEGQMGEKMELTIYTTKGELDADISEIADSSKKANFAFDARTTTEYSSILNNIPTIIMEPLSDKIVGGSDGYSFDELRDAVVNNTLENGVPVTPEELKNYFEMNGFGCVKYIDNVTDRIYFALKTLTDSASSIVPVTNATVKLSDTVVADTDTIIKNIDGSYTVLPTTIYEYSANSATCTPLSTEDRASLLTKSRDDFVDAVNNDTYTRYPYHIRLITSDRYPRAESYNLSSPECSNLVFVGDNVTMSAQMIVTTYALIHKTEGTGGYLLRLGMKKSTDFEALDEADIKVYVQASTPAGGNVGKLATYAGKIESVYVYEVELGTDYHIDEKNQLCINTLETAEGIVQSHYFSLETVFNITTLVADDSFSGISQASDLMGNIPTALQSYIASSRQKLTCHFGSALGDNILNDVKALWSEESYAMYATMVYYTYDEDVYDTNEDGTLKFDTEGNLILLYNAGDTMLDDNGQPMVKHAIGDIMYDADGEAVVAKTRELEYYVNLMQFDMRLFHAEDTIHESYVDALPDTIEAYLNVIDTMNTQLMERTNLYFRPTKTLGSGKFSLGNSTVVTLPLDLSFKIICYVPEFVYTDSKITASIESTIATIIEEALTRETISMTAISKSITSQLEDYIDSIDVGGINGDIQLQTLIVQDDDVKPSVRQVMVNNSGVLALERDIDIEFVKTA